MGRKRSKNRNRNRKRSRNRSKLRSRRKFKEAGNQAANSTNSPQNVPSNPPQYQDPWSRGSEMMINTYQTLFAWHHDQVMRLCPGIPRDEEDQKDQNDQEDQEDLGHQENDLGARHCLDYVYESSSSEEDPEDEAQDSDPIDEEYLKFLEVTIKHQEELRQQRAAATVSTTSAD
ncbi:hypothetical protein KR018_000818 [Drosophila ironensis]|nr:hypothetical protein KR018_000818 [Drosophila ironensis]